MSENVEIDLTGYKDRVGSRVQPGHYTVRVDDAETETAQTSGNNMIVLYLSVVSPGEFNGAGLVDRLVQSKKSMFRTVMFMQAAGLPTPHKKIRLNLAQIIGKVVDVDVDDGAPYLGKVKSEVKNYSTPTAGARSAVADLDPNVVDLVDESAGVDVDPGEVDLASLNLG